MISVSAAVPSVDTFLLTDSLVQPTATRYMLCGPTRLVSRTTPVGELVSVSAGKLLCGELF